MCHIVIILRLIGCKSIYFIVLIGKIPRCQRKPLGFMVILINMTFLKTFFYLNFWCGLLWEDIFLENELVNTKLNSK